MKPIEIDILKWQELYKIARNYNTSVAHVSLIKRKIKNNIEKFELKEDLTEAEINSIPPFPKKIWK